LIMAMSPSDSDALIISGSGKYAKYLVPQ